MFSVEQHCSSTVLNAEEALQQSTRPALWSKRSASQIAKRSACEAEEQHQTQSVDSATLS